MDEKFNLEEYDYNLFWDMIGGHNLIIQLSKGKLLKFADDNEIKFYQIYSKNSCPKFYEAYHQNSNDEIFDKISKFKSRCDNVFREIVKDFDKENVERIHLNNKPHFVKKFQDFIQNKIEHNEYDECDERIKLLKIKLNSLHPDKLKWILYWYVDKNTKFLRDKFIVFEDLTYNFELPAILDLKLGFFYENTKIRTIRNRFRNLQLIYASE